MDPDRFDAFTKLLGTVASRRFTMRRVLGAVLLGMLGGAPVGADESRDGKGRQNGKAKRSERRRSSRREHARKNSERDRGNREDQAQPRRRSKATTRAAVANLEIDYFALGDSIASGHGLGDTGNGRGQWCAPDGSTCCRRSPNAYPFKLRDELTKNHYKVNFPVENNLACSGARIADLAGQVMAVRDRLEAPNRPQRPVLVTVSIGGNDSGMTDQDKAIDVMYLKSPAQFEAYLASLAEFKTSLSLVLTTLLEVPGVAVVLNELFNPMNRKSVYFKGLLDGGDLCGVVSCWDRSERVVQTVNRHWKEVVDEFARNPRYAGRIAMTSGLATEFAQHWGAAGVRRQKCNKNDKKCQKEAAKQPEYREECGYQEPPAGKGSTYILSRTGLDAPPNRTNSFPFRDADLLKQFDLYLFAMGPKPQQNWKGDCVHPNDAGHAAIARKVDEVIDRLNLNCPFGRVCGGSCVDTTTNASHCGGCGVACAAGETCEGGKCGVRCGESGFCVAGSDHPECCAEVCTDITIDEAHCGGCGQNCSIGRACLESQCIQVDPCAGQQCSYEFVNKWGSVGTQDSQFTYPQGIAVDGAGHVYVADSWGCRILKFTSDGTFLAKWGTGRPGSTDGEFELPWGIAVDGEDQLYVADTWNHRIQKFARDGRFLARWGTSGSADGEFWVPRGVAVDTEGHVYVADSGNDRIQKFASDGRFLAMWGSNGDGDGQFRHPTQVAVDGLGRVYVADAANHRIQKFASDGRFLAMWGSRGGGDGQFDEIDPEDPSTIHSIGVAADDAGYVFVADSGNHRIQKFTHDGTYLGKWGSRGGNDGQFLYPTSVAVNGSGNVYVAEGGNRVQEFAPVRV